MRRRLSLKDIPERCLPAAERSHVARKPRGCSKYRNHPVEIDGRKFASKREARYYEELKRQVACGELAGFITQVSIPLIGGARMRLDFLPIPKGMILEFHDPKGYATREWELKKKIAEGLYPIRIITK